MNTNELLEISAELAQEPSPRFERIKLTPRERADVKIFLGRGLYAHEIAKRLNVPEELVWPLAKAKRFF